MKQEHEVGCILHPVEGIRSSAVEPSEGSCIFQVQVLDNDQLDTHFALFYNTFIIMLETCRGL